MGVIGHTHTAQTLCGNDEYNVIIATFYLLFFSEHTLPIFMFYIH